MFFFLRLNLCVRLWSFDHRFRLHGLLPGLWRWHLGFGYFRGRLRNGLDMLSGDSLNRGRRLDGFGRGFSLRKLGLWGFIDRGCSGFDGRELGR